MRYKSYIRPGILIIGLLLAIQYPSFAVDSQASTTETSDQQISDFSLSGYGEKGKKNWDLAGKTADIFTEVVKLSVVVGNLYGKDENIRLTAERGDFNKTDGKVHLEENVVITTSSGTKLTTDALDWDRKNQLVTTDDVVNIKRENMVVVASGARGEPNLKKVALEKDVRLDINPEQPAENKDPAVKEKITITCDGPLDIDYEKSVATFNNNVKVERQDSTIYSDKMDVYFSASKEKEAPESSEAKKEEKEAAGGSLMGNKIDKIVARGNVKVVRGENVSYSEEAIYTAQDKKLTLTGRPKLIIYSTEGLGAPTGN